MERSKLKKLLNPSRLGHRSKSECWFRVHTQTTRHFSPNLVLDEIDFHFVYRFFFQTGLSIEEGQTKPIS